MGGKIGRESFFSFPSPLFTAPGNHLTNWASLTTDASGLTWANNIWQGRAWKDQGYQCSWGRGDVGLGLPVIGMEEVGDAEMLRSLLSQAPSHGMPVVGLGPTTHL